MTSRQTEVDGTRLSSTSPSIFDFRPLCAGSGRSLPFHPGAPSQLNLTRIDLPRAQRFPYQSHGSEDEWKKQPDHPSVAIYPDEWNTMWKQNASSVNPATPWHAWDRHEDLLVNELSHIGSHTASPQYDKPDYHSASIDDLALRKYKRKQAKARMFNCPLCSTAYNRLSQLESHMKMNHGQELNGDPAPFLNCLGCRDRNLHYQQHKWFSKDKLRFHIERQHPCEDIESLMLKRVVSTEFRRVITDSNEAGILPKTTT